MTLEGFDSLDLAHHILLKLHMFGHLSHFFLGGKIE
jgi:hypothetical protein